MAPGFSAAAVQLAQVHMGLTTVLLTIAILVLGVRLYLKSKGTWRLDPGDYFMAVGVVSELSNSNHRASISVPSC